MQTTKDHQPLINKNTSSNLPSHAQCGASTYTCPSPGRPFQNHEFYRHLLTPNDMRTTSQPGTKSSPKITTTRFKLSVINPFYKLFGAGRDELDNHAKLLARLERRQRKWEQQLEQRRQKRLIHRVNKSSAYASSGGVMAASSNNLAKPSAGDQAGEHTETTDAHQKEPEVAANLRKAETAEESTCKPEVVTPRCTNQTGDVCYVTKQSAMSSWSPTFRDYRQQVSRVLLSHPHESCSEVLRLREQRMELFQQLTQHGYICEGAVLTDQVLLNSFERLCQFVSRCRNDALTNVKQNVDRLTQQRVADYKTKTSQLRYVKQQNQRALCKKDDAIDELLRDVKIADSFRQRVIRQCRPTSVLRQNDITAARCAFRGTVSNDTDWWFGHSPVFAPIGKASCL